MKSVKSIAMLLLAASTAVAGAESKTFEGYQQEIESLKAPKVAWREISWKTCLLEGLKKSREKTKPVILWVFIDRPIDDARC